MTDPASISALAPEGGEQSTTVRRVAVVGPFPPIRSGIARHTDAIARALEARDGVEVRCWGFRRQYPRWLYPGQAERDPHQGARPGWVSETLDGGNPVTWQRTAREIRDWGPDLVVLPAWTFALAPALGWVAKRLGASGIERCVVVHNAFDHESTGWKNRLTNWQLAAADRFVTHNHALSDELKRRFADTPLSVFPHPTFDDLPAAKGNLPRRVDLELLFFGLVRPYKGLDLLIDALSMVRRTDVCLTIAGEFWQGLDETKSRIAEHGLEDVVDLVPRFVSDVEAAELFQRADAVMLPYRAVSGSGVVSTSFHYGRAVIASDLPGFSEVVQHGETGWLFRHDSAKALAEAIDSLDRQTTAAAGSAARAFGQGLSWDRFADVVLGAVPSPGAQS